MYPILSHLVPNPFHTLYPILLGSDRREQKAGRSASSYKDKSFGNVIQNTLGKKTCGNIAKFLIALRVNTKGNTAKFM